MMQIEENENEKLDSVKEAAKTHFEKRAKLAQAIVGMAEKLHSLVNFVCNSLVLRKIGCRCNSITIVTILIKKNMNRFTTNSFTNSCTIDVIFVTQIQQ